MQGSSGILVGEGVEESGRLGFFRAQRRVEEKSLGVQRYDYDRSRIVVSDEKSRSILRNDGVSAGEGTRSGGVVRKSERTVSDLSDDAASE